MIDFMAAVSPAGPRVEPGSELMTEDGLDYEALAERVKKALAVYEPNLREMEETARTWEVRDEASNIRAVEMGGQIKKLIKAIEAARKKFVDDPNQFIRAVNGLAKGYRDRLEAAERELKGKIGAYQSRQELERRKAEDAARKAAAEAQARIDREAAAAGVESVKLDAPAVPRAPRATRTAEGSAHIKKIWVFEIVDPKALPAEYMIPDEKAIRAAVRAGVREIAGVRIFQENQTVFRA